MDLSPAVFTRLAADTTVIGLVGQTSDPVAPCIFWGQRDQGSALPALVLEWVGGAPEDLDLEDVADLVESRLQLTALAGTHAAARALVKAASDALMDEAAVDDVLFWGADRDRPIDLTSQGPAQAIMHEVTQDMTLRHSQAA